MPYEVSGEVRKARCDTGNGSGLIGEGRCSVHGVPPEMSSEAHVYAEVRR